MTEQEWLTSAAPAEMLEMVTGRLLPADGTGTRRSLPIATDRKLRLFACACARQVWDGVLCGRCEGVVTSWKGKQPNPANCWECRGTGRVGGLTDPRSRNAVEVAERYADGEATAKELALASIGNGTCHSSAVEAVRAVASPESWMYPRGSTPAAQAALLRCLFGNPFRPLPRWDWRWNYSTRFAPFTLPLVARDIYDRRDWAELPVLADAMEEAGCTGEECDECLGYGKRWRCAACRGKWLLSEGDGPKFCPVCPGRATTPKDCPECAGTGCVPNPLLAHLRGPGPHCRGCHVLDLLLNLS